MLSTIKTIGCFVLAACNLAFSGIHRCLLASANFASRVIIGQRRSKGDVGNSARIVPTMTESQDGLDGLVEDVLRRGRFSLLLRPQLAATLDEHHREQACDALQEAMALVPQGKVRVDLNGCVFDDYRDEDLARFGYTPPEGETWVDGYFLDRHPVTNEQFQEFVADGGYEQMELWATEIWPALLNFVDRSGASGPRYWDEGTFPDQEGDYPVVGICWYEAAAFARWVGKRLPTDAEWIKAGSWPVPLSEQGLVHRQYPWGDEMDRGSAHLWGARTEQPVCVDDYAEGTSVGGVQQLIGNVWEWTSSNFGHPSLHFQAETTERPGVHSCLKSLRGGAYDTYFDEQANCHFQSGDQSIARKHNIGFRCALSVCDVAQSADAVAETAPETEQTTAQSAEATGADAEVAAAE